MVEKFVKVKVVVPGVHYWSRSPVAYLAYPHRHLFHIQVCVRVKSEDREVEFFALQKLILNKLTESYEPFSEPPLPLNFVTASCETIASHLLTKLRECELDVVSVEVSEDDENSAFVVWKEEQDEKG